MWDGRRGDGDFAPHLDAAVDRHPPKAGQGRPDRHYFGPWQASGQSIVRRSRVSGKGLA